MKNITKIIVSLLFFTLFANFFFFRMQTPLSSALFFLGFCVFCFAIAHYHHKSMWLILAVMLYTAFVLATRAARFVQMQGVFALIALSASFWYASIFDGGSFDSFTAVFLAPFYAGFSYLKRAFSLIRPTILSAYYKQGTLLFSDRNKHSREISTLIGFAIGLPIMLILILMFAGADPIYYSYLKHIISPDFIQELPMRIILSIIFMGIALPFILPRLRRVSLSPGRILGRLQMANELTIVMFLVSLVIASFIIIQWPYVFVNVKAETDLSRFGVATYAEYVKKGFIELLQVSAFIYGLLWLGLIVLRKRMTDTSRMLSLFQWIVMGEFIIILFSIARRVYLYQLYHGLTLIRVYGSFFLVWIALMTVTLALRHITKKLRFAFIEVGITILLFVFLGMWNVEHFIIVTKPPTVNKRIDYIYLSRMSADGVNGWITAYGHAKQIIEKYSNMQGEINKDGRREIAYAEYILRRMTYQEYDYMTKYASPIEMRNYINTIADFQNERLEKEKSELTEYKKSKPAETWVKDRLAEIEQIQKGIKNIKVQSLTEASSKTNDAQLNNTQLFDISTDAAWNMGGVQNMQQFDSTSSPVLRSFYNGFVMYGQNNSPFFGNIITRYAKTTALDRLYMQNASDMNAFQVMKQAMPLSQLHALQVKYFELYNRIGKQSARDYEVDISLESPLL